MQAYLIDPKAKTVEPRDYDGDYKSISKMIDCQWFDVAGTEKYSVYVDDEGLCNNDDMHFFMLDGYPQPLVGKGLLFGPTNEDGDTTEAPWTLEEATKLVRFLTVEEVMKMAPRIRE